MTFHFDLAWMPAGGLQPLKLFTEMLPASLGSIIQEQLSSELLESSTGMLLTKIVVVKNSETSVFCTTKAK
jgi:hypothetical protein